MFYLLLRYGIIPFALLGWVLYQLFVKQKKFNAIKQDLFASLFLAGVYLFLAYLIFS